MRFAVFSKALMLGAALACASGAAAQGTRPGVLPAFTGSYEPQTSDERGLWMQADEDERLLRDSPQVVRDEALTRYVKRVLCDAVGQDRCGRTRLYIVEVPQFNASMAPNGTMRVWTGLLLRVQNEAQLASVLGHEFAHFELKHGLHGMRRARDAASIAAWIGVLGAGASSMGGVSVNTSALQIAVYGSYFRFTREQETAADLLSLQYLTNSRYDPGAASEIWRSMMAEADARSVARGLKPGREYKADIFATHPASPERALYLKDQAAKLGRSGELGAEAYRNAIRPHLPLLLAAQVKSNDFGGSEYLLHALSETEGWTADLLFARGELFRQRANPRDLEMAANLFRAAISKGYAHADVHRELGLSLLRNGQEADGKAALRHYLAMRPDAPDANVIRMLSGTEETHRAAQP